MKTSLITLLFLIISTKTYSQAYCQIECNKLDSIKNVIDIRENQLVDLQQKIVSILADTSSQPIYTFDGPPEVLYNKIQNAILKDTYNNDTLYEFTPKGNTGLCFIRKTKFDPGFFDPTYERKVIIELKIIPDVKNLNRTTILLTGYEHLYRKFDDTSSFKKFEKDIYQDYKSIMIKELLILIKNG